MPWIKLLLFFSKNQRIVKTTKHNEFCYALVRKNELYKVVLQHNHFFNTSTTQSVRCRKTECLKFTIQEKEKNAT